MNDGRDGYPVLVRKTTVHLADIDMRGGEEKETKETSFQFIMADWFVEGDTRPFPEKGAFMIFVSETAFRELGRCKLFAASYDVGSGWKAADVLSAETRNELLTLAMGKVE